MQTPINAYTPGPKLDSTRSLLIAMKEKGTLQSYVAQHKNSPEYPYLLALASSIDQVSNAAKAAEHQPPQQTVADQKLASLAPVPAPAMGAMQLPEDVGIGRLPAPNLQKMAGGGIVAFDEGGEVERYADKGFTGYNANAVFNQALQGLFEREGGRTVDTGGLTRYGISQKAYPDLDIDSLTLNDAAQIYKRDYWDQYGLNKIARKNPKLAAAAFDTFVNHGPGAGKKMLEASGGDVDKLLAARQEEYDRLTTENPKKYGAYSEGWKNRLTHLSGSLGRMGDPVDNLPDFDIGSTAQAAQNKKQFPVKEKADARGAAMVPVTGIAAANAAATAAPVLLDKFAPAIVNDPKALANAMRATGATGAGLGALGATGAALSSKAASDLARYTTPEQRQAIAENPMLSAMSGDAGLAGAIMNAGQEEYRPNPNASSYGDQMLNVLKTFVGHPDVRKGAQQEAAAVKKTEKPKQEQYDWNAFDRATENYMADRDMRKAADALKGKPEDKKVVPEEKAQTAQSGISSLFNDPAFLMGLNLMSGKSPYAMQNVGEAGLATAAAMQAQQKLATERESKQSEAQYRRSLGRQAEAYADAIERGAKEKNLELEAEKLVQQRMKDWGASIEGKVAKPDAAAAKEAQIRQTIYQYLGISPTMMQNSAPAMNTAGFKMVGVR
jgi:lysozyme family protein